MGPHFYICRKALTHTRACTTHTTHWSCLSLLSLWSLLPPMLTAPHSPRQAEPVHSQSNTHRMTSRGQGPYHLLLSVSCIDRMGERPPPPFPAHQLCWQVQASKGLPLCPIHAHQHMWWTPAVGASPGPLNREGSAFPPWVGLGGMLVCILHWLDGWGQGWAPCICQGATAHPRGPLVCLWLLSGSTWMEISTGKWMYGGATDKESRELRGRMLCR